MKIFPVRVNISLTSDNKKLNITATFLSSWQQIPWRNNLKYRITLLILKWSNLLMFFLCWYFWIFPLFWPDRSTLNSPWVTVSSQVFPTRRLSLQVAIVWLSDMEREREDVTAITVDHAVVVVCQCRVYSAAPGGVHCHYTIAVQLRSPPRQAAQTCSSQVSSHQVYVSQSL